MSNISESIFDNGKVLVAMADVSHVEYVRHPTIGANGIWVITKHSKWDMEADTWANPLYIQESDKKDFISAFCRYRAEVENIQSSMP